MSIDKTPEKKGSCCELIDSLCNDLHESCVMAHPIKRLIPFLVGALLYLIITINYVGLREDFYDKFAHSPFAFEITLIASMSFFAALSSVWLCVPDMRQQKWLLTVSLTLFATFCAWTGLRVGIETFAVPHLHWHTCYNISILFGAIPALFIFLVSMRGKTTQPLMLTSMNTIAIGGAGYIGLRLVCHSDDIGHICFFHIAPYIAFAFALSIIGRRIYRW